MATDRLKKQVGKGRHLSAMKRERQNEKRRVRNRGLRSALKTEIKRVRTTPTAETLKTTVPQVDKAVTKGIIPRKRASRIISRLTRTVATAG